MSIKVKNRKNLRAGREACMVRAKRTECGLNLANLRIRKTRKMRSVCKDLSSFVSNDPVRKSGWMCYLFGVWWEGHKMAWVDG